MPMPYAGERYLPQTRGPLYYEHLHRYAMALGVARDRDVLDIGCGDGYGAAYLAIAARSVVGVDIDADTVHHAASHYTAMNLSFRAGSGTEIPLADGSVDVVITFETIDRIAEHEQFMSEIARVLRTDGELVLSSRNVLADPGRSDDAQRFNGEALHFGELRDLLKRWFPQVRIYGQRVVAGSAIHPLRGFAPDARCISPATHADQRGLPAMPEPACFIAVCSRGTSAPQLEEVESIFLDPRDDLLAHFRRQPSSYAQLDSMDVLRLEPGVPATAEPEPSGASEERERLAARCRELELDLELERAAADDLLRRLTESEASRRSDAEAAARLNDAAMELQKQLQELQADGERALAAAQRTSAEVAAEHHAAIAAADVERHALASRVEQLQTEGDDLRAHFDDAQQRAAVAAVEHQAALAAANAERDALANAMALLQSESDDLRARLDEAQRALVAEQERAGRSDRRANAAEHQAIAAGAQIAALHEHVTQLEAALHAAAEAREAHAVRADEAERRLELERGEAETVRAELDQYRTALEELLASRSWRVTKPLRLAARAFRVPASS